MHAALMEKYTLDEGKVYLTGTQALVRLLLVQRRRDLAAGLNTCLLYTSPSPRDQRGSRMPSSA